MAVDQRTPQYAYAPGDALVQLPPAPIIAARNPTTRDFAQLGCYWVNTATGVFYGLASITSNSANWVATPAAGATTVTELTITGVNGLDVQNVASTTTISSGTINFNNAGATTTISGDLTVNGQINLADLSINSAALIDLTSTANGPAISLVENGGVNGQIGITAMQGTDDASVFITSTAGGIALAAGKTNASAMTLVSGGGIDITAAGAAGVDLDIDCTGGSLNLTAGEAVVDAIVIETTNAAGGLDVNIGTGGIAIDSTGAISLDGAAASNFSVAGAGVDLTLSSAAGSIVMNAGENAASSIFIHADGGANETIRLYADQGTGIDSINLLSDAGGVQITTAALSATTGLNLVQGAANASIQVGAGAPVHNAPQGTLYLNTAGTGVADRAYINTDGAGTWTNFVTAA